MIEKRNDLSCLCACVSICLPPSINTSAENKNRPSSTLRCAALHTTESPHVAHPIQRRRGDRLGRSRARRRLLPRLFRVRVMLLCRVEGVVGRDERGLGTATDGGGRMHHANLVQAKEHGYRGGAAPGPGLRGCRVGRRVLHRDDARYGRAHVKNTGDHCFLSLSLPSL